MEENQALNTVLNKIRVTGDLAAAEVELATLAPKSQEAKLLQGINLFLMGANNYPRAKEIFSDLYKAGYKEAGYFLALVDYLRAQGEDKGKFWVDLWLEEKAYSKYWLAQYYLNEEFGESDYKIAWSYLQKLPEDDGAAMALRAYLMEEQEFQLVEDLEAPENDPQFWLDVSKQYNYASPYGAENLAGAPLLAHLKAYINQHYGKKYQVQTSFKRQLQGDLAQPSPYRALSFFIGGLFLLIFVILIMVQLF